MEVLAPHLAIPAVVFNANNPCLLCSMLITLKFWSIIATGS